MRKIISISSVSLLLLAPFAWPQATKAPVSPRGPSVAAGSQGVVVSGKAAATAAGIKILEQGGNAADAGAATLLAVVYCFSKGMREIIKDSTLWGRVRHAVIFAFTSKYSLALYDLIAARINLKHMWQEEFSVEDF